MSKVVQLNEKDAVTLLQLLDALERLLTSSTLNEECQRAVARGFAELLGDNWQDGLADHVRAARALLRQLLDGYDPAGAISGATSERGAPSASGRP